MRQILENLLSNAVKFTPEAGRITIALERVAGEARVAVTDTGIGIPANVLSHVFEPFHQADRSITRRYGGLGLGLAIAHHLAVLHGGHIDAESHGEGAGRRSACTCRSRPRPPRPPRPRSSARRDATMMDGVLDRLRVLVVDDEPQAREVLTALPRPVQHQVQAAASVREALASFEASSPDVLLSDIAMPEADGYALIRRIRGLEQPRGRRIAAIAVTALASAEIGCARSRRVRCAPREAGRAGGTGGDGGGERARTE